MSNFYVACDLRAESGHVTLGTLDQGALTFSEVRRFQNTPIRDEDSLQWNIPHLYQEILEGLRAVGGYEEAIDSISCDSWAADYLLFESDSSLVTPIYHHADPRTTEGMQKVLAKVSKEAIYQETGVWPMPTDTLFQLAAERPKRLNRAQYLLPVADAFNYLLAGVPRFEMSQASATQLYNSVTHTGQQIERLYLLGGPANSLLNHFIANALRRPLVVGPADAAAIGNVLVQALALGHLESLQQAREVVRQSFKTETIIPYATAWDTSFDRLTHLCPA